MRVRVFSNYKISDKEIERYLTCEEHRLGPYEFRFNESGHADMVLVLNFSKRLHWAKVPKSRVVKVLQEPVVKSYWTHRFTYKHSRTYSRVLSHSGPFNDRVRRSHGHFPLHVIQPRDFPKKSRSVSVIASTLTILPGHKKRHYALNELFKVHPELLGHAFGRGRREIEDKAEGLRDYRYSIAIENEITDNYFTEKLMDCFALGTVPIYFGARNLSEYFPEGSYFQLDDLSVESFETALKSASEEDYIRRLPALAQASEATRRYSRLCCLADELFLTGLVADGPSEFVIVSSLDTVLTAVWRFAVRLLQKTHLMRPLKWVASRFSKQNGDRQI